MPNNSIDKFLKRIPTLTNTDRDIDSVITKYGDFKELSGIDAIITNILRLLLISKRSYLMDPTFGTGLYRYIFEPADELTLKSIKQEIDGSIIPFENRAKISYDILFFKNKKGFRINMAIKYGGIKKEVTLNVDESLLKTLD